MNKIVKSFVDWRRRNKTIAQLNMLDDRTLNDIGIVRANIVDTVRGLR